MCIICQKYEHFTLHDTHSCRVLNRYKNTGYRKSCRTQKPGNSSCCRCLPVFLLSHKYPLKRSGGGRLVSGFAMPEPASPECCSEGGFQHPAVCLSRKFRAPKTQVSELRAGLSLRADLRPPWRCIPLAATGTLFCIKCSRPPVRTLACGSGRTGHGSNIYSAKTGSSR